MATYTVRDRKTEDIHTVEADSFERAASKVYRQEHGKPNMRPVFARRETGTPGMPGVFVVYRNNPDRSGSGWSATNTDKSYHVSKD